MAPLTLLQHQQHKLCVCPQTELLMLSVPQALDQTPPGMSFTRQDALNEVEAKECLGTAYIRQELLAVQVE